MCTFALLSFFHIHEISFPQLRGAATPPRVCHQGVQDDTQRVQEPGPLHQGRLPLQGTLREAEPEEGCAHVGREGDAQSETVS